MSGGAIINTNDDYVASPESPGTSTISRVSKNIYMLCLVFLFEFSAFQGLANLQSSINCEGLDGFKGLGTISLAVTYVSLLLSSFVLPSYMMSRLGPKWTIAICVACYMVYTAANYYPTAYTMIPASIIMGAAGAPLLTAQAAYVTTCGYSMCERQAEKEGIKPSPQSAEKWVSNYFGVFFFFFEVTQLTGNLISSAVLTFGGSSTDSNFTSPIENPLSDETRDRIDRECGSFATINDDTCPERPDSSAVNLLITIYLGLGVIAILITVFLLENIKIRTDQDNPTPKQLVLNTVRHCWEDKRQQVLIALTMYSGFKQAFLAADLTEGYISCALGVNYVGLVLCGYGAVDALVSWASGKLGAHLGGRFGRGYLLGTAFGLDLVLITLLLLWRPYPTSLVPFFWVAILWSISDAIFQTQLYTVYGVEFNTSTDAAFSNFRVWEALGFAIAYGYQSFLSTRVKLYILMGVISFSYIGYTWLELMSSNDQSKRVKANVMGTQREVEVVETVHAARARGASFMNAARPSIRKRRSTESSGRSNPVV